MTNEIDKKLDELINIIKNSSEYINCLQIKEQMNKNKELNELIEKLKNTQKKYIKTKDKSVKEELDKYEKKLNSIPIYKEYNQYLVTVNEKIELIKEELNNYFNQKLNKDKSTN